MRHPFSRLHVIVCPENIVVDESLMPNFLHYGVKESLPPYEIDSNKLWWELKAAIAAAVDGKHTFQDYLKLHETIELSPSAADIMKAEDENELSEVIRKNIKMLEDREKEYIRVPQKKWKITRYTALGLFIVLLPILAFSLYSLLFTQPKQAAFVNSQEHFLNKEYSEVVDQLSNYKIDQMPRVVQYELAQSYIINEALTEDQKDNVQNTITLQSDTLYYQYWIHIGRGSAKEALDLARSIEDRDLILFALLKYREVIKADESLTADEKQQEIKEIQSEIDEYVEEQKAQKEQEKRLLEEQSNSQLNDEAAKEEQKTEAAPSNETKTEVTPSNETKTECSIFLILEGFTFKWDFSLFYIFGGIIFFPIFLYLTLWALPGFIPGKVLFTIVQGKNGTVISKKGTVLIRNIRNIDMVRNPLNLINDIVIETFDDKKVKIRTYNLIGDLLYELIVDKYIFPYMTENAKKVWDRKVNLEELSKVAKYERQEQKFD